MDNKNYNIFNDVSLLNEGLGTAALISFYIAGLAMVSVTLISEKIKSKQEIKLIESTFKELCKNNEDIRKFDQSVSKIKSISLDEFNKRIGKDPKYQEKYNIQTSKLSIIIMEDDDKNILAYCLFDEDVHTMAYKFIGNYSNDVKMYICAVFEFKLGYYGKNIKHLVKGLERNYRNTDMLKRVKNSSKLDEKMLSNEDKIKLDKDLKTLFNKALSYFKSKLNSCDIETDEYDIIIYDKKLKQLTDDIMEQFQSYEDEMKAEAEYNKYFQNGYEKFISKVKHALKDFVYQNKMIMHGDGAKGTAESFPYTKIDYYEQPDDYCEVTIRIRSIFEK